MQRLPRLRLCVSLAAVCLLVQSAAAFGQRLLRTAGPTEFSVGQEDQSGKAGESEQPAQPQPMQDQDSQTDRTLVLLLGRPGSNRPQKPEAAASQSMSSAVALQIALDRAGFSPGVIDGTIGRKTQLALAAFQAKAGLPTSGQPDQATRQALAAGEQPVLRRYTLTQEDLVQVGPWPKSWPEKSKAKRLGYRSLASLVAERGHCSLALLAKLNLGVNLQIVKPGDTLWLPDVGSPAASPTAAVLDINLSQKVLQARDKSGRVAALFHCSIAKDNEKLPRKSCKVAAIARDPIYIFDPKMWPEVKGIDRKLVIPPGPRNPVGVCWIGLSLKGYGIHGTPEPELIGKTGSHGCIRLTNWDALRLADMLRVGTAVRFTK